MTSGGLRIESTMDPTIQRIMDEEFANPDNFPENVKWYLSYALTIKDEEGGKTNFWRAPTDNDNGQFSLVGCYSELWSKVGFDKIQRRIARYKEGDAGFAPLPDLILCDGALAQIHAVEQVLRKEGVSLPVLGLKKDSRHRTKSLVFPDGAEKPLAPVPEVFSFCGRLQEEVHRVAISYHKNLRQKAMQQSQLEAIPGVGKAKAKALFLHFKSIDKIRKATSEDLTAVKGISLPLAEGIAKWFEEN